METPKISLAYAAGFIDGDGSIMCTLAGPPRQHQVFINATNTDLGIVQAFKDTFGGTVNTSAHKGHPEWKVKNMWLKRIAADGGALRLLHPFLLLKKKQAEVGLELLKRKQVETRRFLGGGRGCTGLTDEEYAARDLFRGEMKRLNALPCNCPHDGVPSAEYLAGFFDAEGSVGIYRTNKNRNAVAMRVSVVNRCAWILEQYRNLFGGYIHKRALTNGWSQTYSWVASARIGQRFLSGIVDRLIVKQERVRDALKVYDYMGSPNGAELRLGNNAVKVLEIVAKLGDHNRRGQLVGA